MTSTNNNSIKSALIWIAHGSKRIESNQAVTDLVNRIAPKLTNKFESVLPAFLELTEPKIEQQTQKLINQGIQKITLFPYFLAPGHHLVNDLPKIQAQLQTQYPSCEFELIEHLALFEDWDIFLLDALNKI
ncbi:MAG: CbiX/SirB N-terminal domain-containing protein [Pseudomonadales bacterium]|nr:CbiX/SirB N-terminal domain-containing protein [Pseudomonadales bacterium]